MKTSALFSYGLLSLFTLNLAAEERNWTSVDGRTLTAELLNATETTARLRMGTGKVVDIPLSKLSPSDSDYVKEWFKQNADSPQVKLISMKMKDAIRDELTGMTGGGSIQQRAVAGHKFCNIDLILGDSISGKRFTLNSKDFTLQCESVDSTATSHSPLYSWQMFKSKEIDLGKPYKSTGSDGQKKTLSSNYPIFDKDGNMSKTYEPAQVGFYFVIQESQKPVRLLYKYQRYNEKERQSSIELR